MADKIQTVLFWLSAIVGFWFLFQLTFGTYFAVKEINNDVRYKLIAKFQPEKVKEVHQMLANGIIKDIAGFVICAIILYITY